MCNCLYQVKALVEYSKTHGKTDVLELLDPLVKTRCFAYTLVVCINANPVAFSILPRKLLINGEPLLIEYGNVYGKDFIIRPSLQVILEEEC
ncbi:nonstructural protein [Thrush coronavirus HKU12-600]|uniref:Nonstructural protein n=1 Tax=Thrush coronavirus HKU12 (isolate Grey-backed thrush/Hong Kong/HKU12-600/2007) TaxID=572290 RepID=B6VDY1_THCOV|nr:nonstructural protein [Thrush coronavirus HKU12-600]ACJ12056.1 nonstructural protein [Thrush coronavirus HKU12-600]